MVKPFSVCPKCLLIKWENRPDKLTNLMQVHTHKPSRSTTGQHTRMAWQTQNGQKAPSTICSHTTGAFLGLLFLFQYVRFPLDGDAIRCSWGIGCSPGAVSFSCLFQLSHFDQTVSVLAKGYTNALGRQALSHCVRKSALCHLDGSTVRQERWFRPGCHPICWQASQYKPLGGIAPLWSPPCYPQKGKVLYGLGRSQGLGPVGTPSHHLTSPALLTWPYLGHMGTCSTIASS